MIYTNKMRIFYAKIRFATKIPKNQCCTTSTKGRCDTSHGQAQMDTDTQNISVDQYNQREDNVQHFENCASALATQNKREVLKTILQPFCKTLLLSGRYVARRRHPTPITDCIFHLTNDLRCYFFR